MLWTLAQKEMHDVMASKEVMMLSAVILSLEYAHAYQISWADQDTCSDQP